MAGRYDLNLIPGAKGYAEFFYPKLHTIATSSVVENASGFGENTSASNQSSIFNINIEEYDNTDSFIDDSEPFDECLSAGALNEGFCIQMRPIQEKCQQHDRNNRDTSIAHPVPEPRNDAILLPIKEDLKAIPLVLPDNLPELIEQLKVAYDNAQCKKHNFFSKHPEVANILADIDKAMGALKQKNKNSVYEHVALILGFKPSTIRRKVAQHRVLKPCKTLLLQS